MKRLTNLRWVMNEEACRRRSNNLSRGLEGVISSSWTLFESGLEHLLQLLAHTNNVESIGVVPVSNKKMSCSQFVTLFQMLSHF